jgi:hypothetical protein
MFSGDSATCIFIDIISESRQNLRHTDFVFFFGISAFFTFEGKNACTWSSLVPVNHIYKAISKNIDVYQIYQSPTFSSSLSSAY